MNITVYCGANIGNDAKYKTCAEEVGRWIATNHHHLIYGGGGSGLMRVIADTVLSLDGKVTGIIPTFMLDIEDVHPGLTALEEVETMQERKARMITLGDAYIALPGGPGTLEEISEVVSWMRIGQNQNPCIFYNETGYYDTLKAFFETMIAEGFLTERDYKQILFAKSLEEMDAFIASYTPLAYAAPIIQTKK